MNAHERQEVVATEAGAGLTPGSAAPAEDSSQAVQVIRWNSAWMRKLNRCPPKDGPLDLAYEEYCRLRDLGEVDQAEFLKRFPDVQNTLRKMIEAHRLAEWALPDDEEVSWPECGDAFLGFNLQEELGKGAFARVYLATEPCLGERVVAVKISRQGGAEAEILGSIKHRNIVPVHSVKTDAERGLTVVCMPYLGSATLRDVLEQAASRPRNLARGRLILDAVRDRHGAAPHADRPDSSLEHATYFDAIRRLGVQLTDALAFIHERGICHRDLKPSNVLMTPDGTPMLLDFNLSARAKDAHAGLGGTLLYMSPEQLLATAEHTDAEHSLLDHRSDLYSLGVILYMLVTGEHPFGPLPLHCSPGELRTCLLERQRLGPVPMNTMGAGVDGLLGRLVESCVAYNPKDRPQSAAALAAALRKDLRPARRALRWLSRHPRTVLSSLILSLVLSGLGAFAWSQQAPYSVREYRHGLTLYQEGRFSQAVEHFNLALVDDVNHADVRFARGRAYQQLGESDSRFWHLAIADYEEADRRAPSGQVKACWAYCYQRLRQSRPAIHYYRLALEAGFAPAQVLNNLGCSHLLLNELDATQEHLDHALVLDPNLAAALHNRALLWLQRAYAGSASKGTRANSLERGRADICRVIALGPATAEVYYHAAQLHLLDAGKDQTLLERALHYVELAVEHGHDPKKLVDDGVLASLRKVHQFQALAARPRSVQPPQKTRRVLDPLGAEIFSFSPQSGPR